MKWWEKHPERLNTEVSYMKEKFPHFQMGETEFERYINGYTIAARGQRYWLGDLRTISGNIYKTLLIYPIAYPGSEIKVYVLSPEIDHGSHIYGDGRLCLYSNDHGGKGQGAGPSMTAVSYVGWTATWLHAHEIYKAKGTWPDNNYFNKY